MIISFILVFQLAVTNRDDFKVKTIFSNFLQIEFDIFAKYIIIFISSNYLIVSGEHRVHFNTNVCSRFCCTTHPFQTFGYPSLLPYMGVRFSSKSFDGSVCQIQRCTLKAISPITQPYRFLCFSPHIRH